MTNLEAVERFDQAHSAKINKLFWIAGSIDNRDLKDMIDELDEDCFKKLFPEIFTIKNFKYNKKHGLLLQYLIDYNKFGLIAEIYIPKASHFLFKKGKPVSWKVYEGNCRVEYVYAESLEDLMNNIETIAGDVFKEYVNDYKKAILK